MPAKCNARTEVVRETFALQPAGHIAAFNRQVERKESTPLHDAKHDNVAFYDFRTCDSECLQKPAH